MQARTSASASCAPTISSPKKWRYIDCECAWEGRHTLAGEAALHWVVAGGESGPNARPMHPEWALSLRDQCTAAGVRFFFKHWGEWAVLPTDREREKQHIFMTRDWDFVRVGKMRAGHLLDGREHREIPHG